jgi:hypothetical protein
VLQVAESTSEPGAAAAPDTLLPEPPVTGDEVVDAVVAALATAVAATRAVPLTGAVRGIADELLRDEQGRDDVCLLLLEWAGGRSGFVPAP